MSKAVVIPAGSEGLYNNFHFAPAIKSNGFVFLSGQIGTNPDGSIPDNIEAQAANAFEGIGETLAEAGASFDDIVDITSFHVGLRSHMRDFMKIKDKYINEPYPSWTAVGTTELAIPGALVEIRIVAKLPE